MSLLEEKGRLRISDDLDISSEDSLSSIQISFNDHSIVFGNNNGGGGGGGGGGGCCCCCCCCCCSSGSATIEEISSPE